MIRSALPVLLLVGCAQQPAAPDRQAEIEAAMQSAQSACRAHLADPRLDQLRSRIPDRLDLVTFDQMADNSRPAPAEIPALKVRAEAFLRCQAEYRGAMTRTGAPAPYLTAHDMNANRIAGLYANLVNGEISYGSFLRTSKESSTARQQAFQEIDAAMRADGEREATRRLQAYQVWRSMQPVTCFRNGAYTSCN